TCSPRNLLLTGHGVARLLDVEASAIDFGNVLLGQTAQQTITLTNLSRNPLIVQSIDAGPLTVSLGGAPLPLTLAPGEVVNGAISWSPRALGPLQSQVSFAVSDGAAGIVAIKGNGFGPVLQATPKSLFVGSASIGTSRSGSITFTNIGSDAPLQIAGVQ